MRLFAYYSENPAEFVPLSEGADGLAEREPQTADIRVQENRERGCFEATFLVELRSIEWLSLERRAPTHLSERSITRKTHMASDYFRKSETAIQALGSLFAVLGDSQEIQIVYRGGMIGDNVNFSMQMCGKARGDTAREAEDNAVPLKRNLEFALGTLPGLRFCGVDLNDCTAKPARPEWRGRLSPCGVLASAERDLKSVGRKSPTPAVSICPDAAGAPAVSVADAVLVSPRTVEVAVSVKPRSLDESGKQALRDLLLAIEMKKAAYLALPERRKASVEEREALVPSLHAHLRHWLLNPSGIEIDCVVYAAERPSETLLAMLGKALFPNRSIALSIEPFENEPQNSPAGEQEIMVIDLSRCLNAMSEIPAFFPDPRRLAAVGAKRRYPRPTGALASHGLLLGFAEGRAVRLPPADRSRHAYIVGATGSGKTTLLYNMIMQDIAAGEGVCVVDPHGDLYRDVLNAVPAERVGDVTLFDPCDFERAVGLNFLECTSLYPQIEMSLLVNGMIEIFDRLYDLRTTGGPMFELYMRNALLLAMDNDESATLMDVPRLFEDKEYRDFLKGACRNPLVVRFWNEQAERAGGECALANIAPYVTSKLNRFTHNALLRPIVGQRKSGIDFRRVMDERRILLANLSKGLLGELDAQLLGMLLIGKLSLAAMSRVDIPEERRVPFHWYIDEFQNFTADGVAGLLSESRKFGLRMTLANQNLAQLERGRGKENLAESVLGNAGNLIFFRVGAADAGKLATYASPELDAQDLQYLPDFQAAARLLNGNTPLRPFVFETLPKRATAGTEEAGTVRDRILDDRRAYTRPVSEVEKEILTRSALRKPKDADKINLLRALSATEGRLP